MYVVRLVSVLLECFHDDSWPLAVHVHDIVTDWTFTMAAVQGTVYDTLMHQYSRILHNYNEVATYVHVCMLASLALNFLVYKTCNGF